MPRRGRTNGTDEFPAPTGVGRSSADVCVVCVMRCVVSQCVVCGGDQESGAAGRTSNTLMHNASHQKLAARPKNKMHIPECAQLLSIRE
jgi:hypothetical protein